LRTEHRGKLCCIIFDKLLSHIFFCVSNIQIWNYFTWVYTDRRPDYVNFIDNVWRRAYNNRGLSGVSAFNVNKRECILDFEMQELWS
jgi:hypothetical protein